MTMKNEKELPWVPRPGDVYSMTATRSVASPWDLTGQRCFWEMHQMNFRNLMLVIAVARGKELVVGNQHFGESRPTMLRDPVVLMTWSEMIPSCGPLYVVPALWFCGPNSVFDPWLRPNLEGKKSS